MEQRRTDSSIRIAALLVSTSANFLTPFMSSAVNIALPAIGVEFSADAILLSWVPTSYLLAAAMFTVRRCSLPWRRPPFCSSHSVLSRESAAQ
jgi:hypothetical protein